MSVTEYDRATAVAAEIRERAPGRAPALCLVLGSGLGGFADVLEDRLVIPYHEIEGFPRSTVEGHAGNLVFGRMAGRDVVALQGRVHYYECGDMLHITRPMRIMRRLGCTALFVTNSAGTCNPDFRAGDLMLITDHLNLMMGGGPLMGPNDTRFGPRFPDMSRAYDPELREQVLAAAADLGLELRQGVYAAFHGPEYETPAEVRMARILGADAVGMSTVPEVVVANHMGMRCVGISCLSNLAAGMTSERLSHDEVVETAARVAASFVSLLTESVKRIVPTLTPDQVP